ncbi:pyochelin synthetase [Ruminiclostridium sufflavum DSM 19573]|uniref:Pyochelin synthetase n=1 Tax=Ruminiclostridium sufflavum DSM 19573 TaxID=1121337 RepID=A0A318XPH5_9FIRM|nr:non-ribosomal peptide synthetase [Ruminiclostridium sufflavum]PYG90246.1 pyochelin synthetase [Ruminiclostridium sufflavum DSM 19573]
MEFVSAERVLEYCRENNIRLFKEGEKLKYRTIGREMTPQLIDGLKRFKADILQSLEGPPAELYINKTDRYEPFPLSNVQAAYLFGRNDAFQYGGVACHIYLELTYDRLEHIGVKSAWKKLIERHDMLRAVIQQEGSQIVLRQVPELDIPCFKLGAEINAEAEEYIEKMKRRVYQPGEWPMFGIALSEYSKKTVMHFSIEFLIADWTSIWMLLSEFEALYFEPDKELSLPGIQFRDYILYEKEEKKGAGYERDKAYWLEKIEKIPSAPELPLSSRYSEGGAFRRKSLLLPPKSWNSFKDFARKYGVTPTAAVLEVYAHVLERWSGSSRFSLNMTVLSRKPVHPDIGKVVGDFTTLELIEIDHTVKKSFYEAVKNTNKGLFEDLDHNLFSGVEVLRELSRRNKGNPVLMPFVFTSAIGLLGENSRLKGSFEKQGISQTPQVFIDCQVMDGEFGMQANWDYREELFPEEMTEDMFGAFQRLLEELSESEQSWKKTEAVVSLPVWQLDERESVNNTYTETEEKLLYQDFIDNVSKHPGKIAAVDTEGAYTYGELHAMAETIAEKIVKNGGKAGENIAVIMKKSRHQVAAVLGSLYMGGVYVPVEADQAKKRQEEILKDISADIILTAKEYKSRYAPQYKTICIDETEQSGLREKFQIGEHSPEDKAYIIFTSGSTGRPKGVVISHRAAFNTIRDINARFAVGGKDSIFGISKLNFDLSVYDIFGILSAGGTVIYPGHEEYMNPAHWLELLQKYGITVWNSVPALMNMLLSHTENMEIQLNLKKVFLSGDWIPLGMPDRIHKLCPCAEVICMGGATEASIWSIFHIYTGCGKGWSSIPYGIPLANQSFMVLDSRLENCPVWVKGDIYISGKGLAEEYYNDTELTGSRFFKNPATGQRMYRTGDTGRYLPGGRIEFLGREDNQVKIYGHRIELGEIEKAMEAQPQVNTCAVFAENNELGAAVEAAKESQELQGLQKEEFRSLVSGLVPDNSLPKSLNDKELFVLAERNRLSAEAILYSFQQMGLLVKGKSCKESDITDKFTGLPRFRWLIKPWLKSLLDNGLVTFDGSAYTAGEDICRELLEEGWKGLHDCWQASLGDEKINLYIEKNAKNIIPILEGKLDPLGILYPDGSNEYVRALYRDNAITAFLNRCMAEFIVRLSEKRKGRTLRILEIGAGSGATTEILLEAMKGRACEYCYTDISKYFFADARSRFEKCGNVTFRELDINKDIREQGFKPNSYDIVAGAFVLENAHDLEKSMARVEELLAPKGYLLFTAPLREEEWLLASQALMMEEGEDEFRRDIVFMNQHKWKAFLSGYGASEELFCVPEADNIRESKLGLNLFIKPFKQDKAWLDEGQLTENLKELLPEYMIPRNILFVDKMPLTDNGKLDRKQALAMYKDFAGKKQADKTGLPPSSELEKKLAEIFEGTLKCSGIYSDDNLYDYGADSLSMAQAAAKIRNEINADIPFEKLLRQILNTPVIKKLEEFIIADGSKEAEPARKDEEKPFAYTKDFGGDNGDRLRVLIHNGLGIIENYVHLGKYLAEQNQGRIMAIGLADTEKYCSLKEDEILGFLADTYTDIIIGTEMKRIQLIGYCYSGTIAVEIAKRLMERGIAVDDVCVIDGGSMPITVTEEFTYEMMFANIIGLSLEDFGFDSAKVMERLMDDMVKSGNMLLKTDGILEFYQMNSGKTPDSIFYELRKMKQEERLEYYQKRYKLKTGKDFEMASMVRLFGIFKQSFHVYVTPGIYFGNIRYFSVKEKAGMYKYLIEMIGKWKDICMGDFSITEINGDHFSCIENAVYAEELSGLLK